jgi:topoisomerase-4 subunit A
VRDESADDIRLILEPKNGQVDAVILMEQLFKLTELEVRFGLNLNVLDRGTTPRVMSLADALRAWLEHRKEVLVRRSQFRVDQITARLEVLDGYIIAYLNLDEVIRIIREEDDAKASLIVAFNLTDNQAEAILNMRLRSLRKLEEMELRTEHSKLSEERTKLETLLGSEKRQWGEIAKQVEALKKAYPLFDKDGVSHPLGARRTILGVAPKADLAEITEAFIEREPITVVLSEKGWIRAPKGHNATVDDKAFKSGDRLRLSFNCETTDKLLMLTTDGRVYTIGADKLPGGRGQGEPVRLLVDMEESADIVALFVHKPGQKRIIASSAGYGFIVSEDDMMANTRKGKQVLNVSAPEEAKLIVTCDGDRVAIIGQNRKLLVFPMAQLAQMTRGKGVRLQRYKDGGVSDIKTFFAADGLTWQDSSGRTYSKPTEELVDWAGDRAAAGRQPPTGFPKNNKFVG